MYKLPICAFALFKQDSGGPDFLAKLKEKIHRRSGSPGRKGDMNILLSLQQPSGNSDPEAWKLLTPLLTWQMRETLTRFVFVHVIRLYNLLSCHASVGA